MLKASGHGAKGVTYATGKSTSKTAMPSVKVGKSAGNSTSHAVNRNGDPKGAKC